MKHLFPPKPALAIATFVFLLAVPEFVPALKNYRALEWRAVPLVAEFTPQSNETNPELPDPRRSSGPARSGSLTALRDPKHSLDHFYQALHETQTRKPGAATRILHYGDSPTTADLITADARALFQKYFGSGGHGFHLIAKPWAWYEHHGVRVESKDWLIDPATQSALRDGVFGLGGVSFRGSTGAAADFRLREGVQEIELAYLAMPGGGRIAVSINGAPAEIVDTSAAEYGPGYAHFESVEGARAVRLEVVEGSVRLFGVNFERTSPGVVYNSLGLNGAYISVLSRMFQERHWAAQLSHYRPDLVIINYGTNESVYADFIDKVYSRELKEVIRRIRSAVPQASVLVMSPMDRGTREVGGSIGTVPVLPRLVAMQERLATENGCAFFDTFHAMGGPGTMGRWYQTEPRLVSADFIHPLPAGAKIVGGLLFRSLNNGFEQYKAKRLQATVARTAPAEIGAEKNP